jgi:hypothetical protein
MEQLWRQVAQAGPEVVLDLVLLLEEGVIHRL